MQRRGVAPVTAEDVGPAVLARATAMAFVNAECCRNANDEANIDFAKGATSSGKPLIAICAGRACGPFCAGAAVAFGRLGVDFAIHDSVKGHSKATGSDHRNDDPQQGP